MGVAGALLAALLWLAGAGVPTIVLVGVLLASLAVAASFPVRRALKRREAAQAAALADRLADLVATHAPVGSGARAATAGRPALTLPDADDASSEAPVSLRRNGPLHG